MKIRSVLVLATFLIYAVSVTGQMPLLSANNNYFKSNNLAANPSFSLFQKDGAKLNMFGELKDSSFNSSLPLSKIVADCRALAAVMAPLATAAAPCNGVSVTPINFNNASRTVESGTDSTVGVVYRYTNAGTAPDGTVVDALVTVQSYANNQDSNQTNFRSADIPGATAGFDGNLQPSINQETGTFATTTNSWTGNITYRIQFVVTGTTTLKRLTVAATSIDNDGAGICGVGLRESVTYSNNRNQTLINTSTTPGTTQVVNGNTVTGPTTTQNLIGTGSEYANSALYVNVTELNWTYAFATDAGANCTAGGASQDRFGSLNLSCQIAFNQPFASVALSGNVFNDTNGLTDNTVNGTGTGTPGGVQLYANLLDANGFVVSSVAVGANGAYSFPVTVAGAYNIQISTNQGVESSAAPAFALPAGWVSTGEFIGTTAGNDGTANGLLPVTVAATAIANANFGIEQGPTAANNTATAQTNPGGTVSATVPATTFSGTDATLVTNIRITAFPTNATTITINGTTYTAANFPVGGVTVPTNAAGNPTQPILVDPINGAVTVAIPYVTLDAANVASAAATASVPFATVGISGNVLNDTNGLSDGIVNGTGTNAGGLFANLLDANGNVVQSVAVPASGAYSFAGLNSGSYTVQISTNAGTVGNAAPANALPAGWVSTGEFVGTAAGNDGTINSRLPITLGATSITNANFGIEQGPTAANNTATAQTNPGGTVNATVPATTFSGTDATLVTNIRITTFPTNATTITINGTTYTAANFPVGGVTVPTNAAGNPTQPILVDPIDGATTVVISYVTLDAANVASAAATASVPFATASISGSVFNDANGLTDSIVNGTGTNAGGLFANLLDSNGNVVQSVAVPASGVYSFAGLNGGSYTVQISTNAGTVGNAAPATALPAGWVSTGEFIGTVAGNDGTNNGLLPVVLGATSITNANFGIEQRPVANNGTATAQTNPGGTNSATVPAGTFTATDPNPGTISSIIITTFPTNATTITINGTTYTAANFPVGGVTVPTNAAGNPTQPILVDPINGATTVVISYVAVDNAGVVSSTPATASIPFATVGISGNVLNDTNGLTDSIVNGTGTNAGGLFANLLDSNGNVVQSVAVPASGAYSFAGLNSGTYTVQISTNAGTVGNAAPATVLPAGWVSTGEFVGTVAGNDGTNNGLLPIVLGATSITNANFGIEQGPTAANGTAASQTNPGGTVSATVPTGTFSGTDATAIANIRITAFPTNATSLTVGTTTYYPNAGAIPATCPTAACAVFPAGGVTVPTNAAGNPTQPILVDPINGATTVVISYVTLDAANVASAAATASVPFATASISGSVFNDANGLSDGIVNGTGTNAGGLFANLLDSNGNVVQSVAVPASGAYSFAGLNSGTYTVQISTNAGTVGNAAPATALPAGWVSTGEFVGTVAGNDGTNNGLLPVIVGAASVTNANFGIEQRPVANNGTATTQPNPLGTGSALVPAGTFTATDPNPGTVSGIIITAFPTNATTITINGTVYTAANFPVGGVTVPTNAAGNPTQTILVDPINGATTVVISYVAVDNAGVVSSTPATASVPFSNAPPTASDALVSGRLLFNDAPVGGTLVQLTNSSSNKKEIVRTDANGLYQFKEAAGGTYIIQVLSSKYSFSPSNRLVNLREDATAEDFFGTAKNYHPKNDFDGDGKSDVAVYRASEGNWYVLQSSDDKLSVFNFGIATDIPVAGDFDGDGKADYAVYRQSEGNWYIWQSASQSLRVARFGLADDKLVPADYDGDGKADVAVYRDGLWYINRSSDGSLSVLNFGSANDNPSAADYDGDGKADASVYRASEGNWYVLNSSNNNWQVQRFGLDTDVQVVGDYDGDGSADIAQFRSGVWYILASTTNFEAAQLGQKDDQSIVGDYNGDGRADITVFRDGVWSIRNSGSGKLKTVNFGLATDTLVK